VLLWSNRRWVDPSDPADLAHLDTCLHVLQDICPGLQLARVVQMLTTTLSGQSFSSMLQGSGFFSMHVAEAKKDESDTELQFLSDSLDDDDIFQAKQDFDFKIPTSPCLDLQHLNSAAKSPDPAEQPSSPAVSGGLIGTRRPECPIPRTLSPGRGPVRLQWPHRTGPVAAAAAAAAGVPSWAAFACEGQLQLGTPSALLASIFQHVPARLREAVQGESGSGCVE
jgi:hypothetical protein